MVDPASHRSRDHLCHSRQIEPDGEDVPDGDGVAVVGARGEAPLSDGVDGVLGQAEGQAPNHPWDYIAYFVIDNDYAGFGYTDRRGRDESYASMTAAGIAVLAICRQALGEAGALLVEAQAIEADLEEANLQEANLEEANQFVGRTYREGWGM